MKLKRFIWLCLLAPVSLIAQKGFEITGKVTGYENGTPVSFLNDQTGEPEKQTTIENNTFRISGELVEPEFKVLVFGNTPPAVPVFLENTRIEIVGSKDSIDKARITGSKSHTEYVAYMKQIQPYMEGFQKGVMDESNIAGVTKIAGEFVRRNPGSYVAPIALIQLMQLQKVDEAQKAFDALEPDVKKSQLAQYINSQLTVAKINATGSVIPDFSQKDTSGKEVSIRSFRGKYVLIDFWASWCMPCRQENPNLVANFEKYKDKNFTVLGVSLDNSRTAWMAAIKKDHLNWTQLSDLKGWQNAVAAQFHINQIPQNILIDPDGKIIGKNLRGADLGNKLAEVLGE